MLCFRRKTGKGKQMADPLDRMPWYQETLKWFAAQGRRLMSEIAEAEVEKRREEILKKLDLRK